MSRKVLPCEYCEEELTQIPSNLGDDLVMELYPGKLISATAFFINQSDEGMEEACVGIPMNYCPNCGRKLI